MRGQKRPLRAPNLMIGLSGVWMDPLVLCTQCSVRTGLSLAGGFYGFQWLLRKRIALPLGLGDFLSALS